MIALVPDPASAQKAHQTCAVILSAARMEGNVVFRDDNSTPEQDDDDSVSAALPRVEFDQASLNRMGGLSVQPLPR